MRFLVPSCLLLLVVTVAMDVYPKNYGVDIQNYAFHLTLSDETDVIRGVAEIDAVYRDAGQTEFRLDLVQNNGEKGMTVSETRVNGEAAAFRHEDDQVWVRLPGASSVGQEIRVTVAYSGEPITGLLIAPNKHGDRTFFSNHWPNRARNWLPTVDHPYDKATSELIVTAPVHYQIASNGLQIEETNLGGGMKLTHWKNSVPIATWLFSLAAAEFAVQRVGEFRGKDIETWVYWQDRDDGFYDFAVPTPHALEFFSDYVGPYAYESLANIQSNSVGGGMEAASSIFYGDRSVNGQRTERWRIVIIHEIAHQWFGNAVTESDWDDVWLSESFATYFTLLFREHAYGREDFVRGLKLHREGVKAWIAENGTDFRIIHDNLDPIAQGTVSSYPITYERGAWVLHMLRDRIGDEAWWSGIRSYYKEFFNANATTADFLRHMEAASGQDLDAYLDQWLRQGGQVTLDGSWSYADNAVTLNLRQTQTDYAFDVPVEIGIYSEGADTPEVVIMHPGTDVMTLTVDVDAPPDRVVIDPRTVLMAEWTFGESGR